MLFSSEGPKDSLVFIEETKEFVCSLATFELRAAVVETSAQFPRGVNEMEQASLAPAPCRLVRPPRVAASPCALECKLLQIIDLKIWTASHPTATSCSDRWSASTSRTASSRMAGSTPPRCSRSRVAATPIIPSSTRCSRSRGQARRQRSDVSNRSGRRPTPTTDRQPRSRRLDVVAQRGGLVLDFLEPVLDHVADRYHPRPPDPARSPARGGICPPSCAP